MNLSSSFSTVTMWFLLLISMSTAGCISYVETTSRATYHDINKIVIGGLVINANEYPQLVNDIVSDINSLSTGKWKKSLGGKEGSWAVSVHLYQHTDEPIASFSMYPEYWQERAADYSHTGARGFFQIIDIRKTPALQSVWCEIKTESVIEEYDKYCKQTGF